MDNENERKLVDALDCLARKMDLILERLTGLESRRGAVSSSILTLEEAMDYVKITGRGVTPSRLKLFYRWRKRWRVTTKRRYSKDVLDLALAREAGVVRLPKNLQK